MTCSDSPRWMWWYHWLCWLLSASGVLCILIGHEHYSIDVLVGYFATTRIFWWYHTMASTRVGTHTRDDTHTLFVSFRDALFLICFVFLLRRCVRPPVTTCRGPGGARSSISWSGTSRRRFPLSSRGRWTCRRPADKGTRSWKEGGTSEEN